MNYQLFTAGPIQVPQHILQELAQPLLYHRDSEFITIFEKVIAGIQYLLKTSNDVLAFTASGTGGMEAVVVNLLSKNDRVLVIDQGKFSARWAEICSCYGVDVIKIELPWRDSIDIPQLRKFLKIYPDLKAVLLTHCETSTGALNDIEAIAREIRTHCDALIVVDAISTVGVIPYKMDEWGVDVTLISSNKGLLNPPGLVFIALNSKAWACQQESTLPAYYFSFALARDAYTSGRGSAFTPAIPLIMGTHKSLQQIEETGLEHIWQQHQKLAKAFRAAINALGLNIWPQNPSDSLTVIHLPPSIETNRVVSILKEKFNIIVSGGQGELKKSVVRIGHLGEVIPEKYADVISALESILIEYGFELKTGVGVKAFFESYASA